MKTEIAIKDSMSLSELTEVSANLMSMVSQMSGELTPEIEEMLNSVDLAVGNKIDSYKFLINKLATEAEFWKQEAEARYKIAAYCNTVIEKMELAIKDTMAKMGVKEVGGAAYKAVITPTKCRLIINEELLPDEWKIQEVRMIPDKAKIRDALESFASVPGAEIKGGLGLRFYLSKKG